MSYRVASMESWGWKEKKAEKLYCKGADWADTEKAGGHASFFFPSHPKFISFCVARQ
jgi:hypothetical protein